MKHFIKFLSITFLLSIHVHAQTWTSHSAGIVDIFDVSFPTIDSGYAIDGNGVLHKTFDGATTWSTVIAPANIGPIFFVTGKIGCVGVDSVIYRTANAGVTWIPVLYDNQVSFVSIYFVNALTGFAAGFKIANDSTRLYKTLNGGLTWTKVSTLPDQLPQEAFCFFNSTTGFWANNFNISSTLNGGSSFSTVYNNFSDQIVNIYFPNIDTGYAVGYYGLFVKSTDGGLNWTQTTYPGSVTYDIHFFNGSKGFACGGNGFNAGYVMQTSDGGASWSTAYSSTNTFGCMDFPSDTIGYVGGQNGTILKFSGTPNGITENLSQHLLSVYPNPTNGTVNINNTISGAKICLMNLSGQIIIQETAENVSMKMNLENVAAGIYFIEMENEGVRSVQKLIVE
ncbi:MAG: T9SS type A sorting domain-containing protein [Bacteroidetes bacterium]|jgi:photosystem II stability/assembly factor-like uncharacterized protein|nr:T9SS type A sorting domain-containing protein [Bacteroidota bacterium]